MLIWVSGETSGVPAAGEIVIAEAKPGRITTTSATTHTASAVRRAGTPILAAPDAPPSIQAARTGIASSAVTGTKMPALQPPAAFRDAVSDSTAQTYNAVVTTCQTLRHQSV
jgi:hypothetical protein